MKINNSDLQNKTILVINAGSIKKKFIFKRLKSLGLNVILMNRDKPSWLLNYVDNWIICETNYYEESLEALKAFLKQNKNINIDGVITFWDDCILLTSKITDVLKLPGIPLNIAKTTKNKHLFRSFCNENNLITPKHILIKNEDDLDKIKDALTFPIVMKPIYGANSAFVIKVETPQDLESVYEYIYKNISSSKESSEWDGLQIMVEEYLDGDEVDIDIILQNGKIKFYSITDNVQPKEPFFLENGSEIPSGLPDEDQEKLVTMAEECLEKLKIQNGCIHFEAKSTSKGPVPIEINLRMGGDNVYDFVKAAWNIDLIEYAVKIALGIYIPKIDKLAKPKKHLIQKYLLSDHSGIIHKLEIDEALKKKPYFDEIHIFKKVGDTILSPPEGYECIGWLTVSGDNKIDARDNMENALKFIDFEIAKYKSASSIGKTKRKNNLASAYLTKSMLTGRAKIEHIRSLAFKDQRNLHIGIACNLYSADDNAVESELTNVGKNIETALKERNYKVSFLDFNNIPQVMEDISKKDINLVFNVCERINNSSLLEPHTAALFDILQIPYTGSNPITLGTCIDKIKVKKLLNYHNIPTPKWDYAYEVDDSIDASLKYPLIVKPANSDNSIGITNDSVVTNKGQLKVQLSKVINELHSPALIEEYIEGDEYDISILGSEEDDLQVLPLSRSIFDKLPGDYWHIFPFDAKWDSNSVYKEDISTQRPPKNVNKKLISLITEIALDTYMILDCHDYGRVEVKIDKNNNPYVLELNPNPSINIPDCVPSVAKIAGMDYGDFLEEVIRLAIKRYKDRPPYHHLQPSLM